MSVFNKELFLKMHTHRAFEGLLPLGLRQRESSKVSFGNSKVELRNTRSKIQAKR